MTRAVASVVRLGRVYLPVRVRLEFAEVPACDRCGRLLDDGYEVVVAEVEGEWTLACPDCVTDDDRAVRAAAEAEGERRIQVLGDEWQPPAGLSVPDRDPRGGTDG